MFWKKKSAVKSIQQTLEEQRLSINALDKFVTSDRKRTEWCTVHQRECKSTGLLMWEKDLNYRYTFLNTRHCNDFFQISLANVRSLLGKTDLEIIKEFKERTGLTNTFGEMCLATDIYTLEHNASCRFWELGYIGNNIFIFDVTKQPLLKNGEVIGTKSWAFNKSANECEIKTLLELFLKTGEAIRLNKYKSNKIASYLIKKNINPFNGVFPV